MRCAILSLGVAGLAACPGPQPPTPDSEASTPDGADASADVSEDVALADTPDVLRCGPDATRIPTNQGVCYVESPMPDGGQPPPGRCVPVVDPAARARANEHDGTAIVLPSGRRVTPGAHRLGLSGFPDSVLRLPGTQHIVVSDTGAFEQHLRIVDVSTDPPSIVPGADVPFAFTDSRTDPAIFYGLAFDATARVLYAAGGGSNRIYAFDVTTADALTPAPGRTIDLHLRESDSEGLDAAGHPQSAFIAGIALSDDGTEIFAALQRGHAIATFSTMTGAMTHLIPVPPIGEMRPYPYVLVRRPGDVRHVYVSLWGAAAVIEVDVNAAMITRTFNVGKNPTELLFSPDGARLYVAASDSDAVSVIDLSLPSAPVANHYLGGSQNAPRGISPVALAWGPGGRLFVAEEDDNAIGVYDGTTFARIGRIATEWYPSDVDVASDGTLVVINAKGLGTGGNLTPQTVENDRMMAGSIQRIDPLDDAALATSDTTVEYNNHVVSTFESVTCPSGATYDFPVPRADDPNPSSVIRHVILVIRENKTYDAIFGDYTGPTGNPADGDPALTLAPTDQMNAVFPNIRDLARRFAISDNFYSNAELSHQGHGWTTAGRTSDATERMRLQTDRRGTRGTQLTGLFPVGDPEEGDIFVAMARAGVTAENWGEIVGQATSAQRAGSRYPGMFWNMTFPDIVKATAFTDFVQGRNSYGYNSNRRCALPSFTYILLPNDHTAAAFVGMPTPRSFLEDNDEGTGFLIDAVSHSRFWPETLVIVIEDDPAGGGDHVDSHRSLVVMASPWIRRGHVTHAHTDVSALHHTIERILGVPPHNRLVATTAPLYDMFTSTPDFTPYDYIPRTDCPTMNTGGRWAPQMAGMDLSRPDSAPGLDRLVWQMLHDGRPAPWRDVPDDD